MKLKSYYCRAMPELDAGHDVVLLLGPLYHLLERTEREPAILGATAHLLAVARRAS